MQDLLILGQTVELLTDASQRAMERGDVSGFVQLIEQRTPLLQRCLALWEVATEAERLVAQPHLQAMLAVDAALLDLGLVWLQRTRQQFAHLRRGRMALQGYGRPLQQACSGRFETHC